MNKKCSLFKKVNISDIIVRANDDKHLYAIQRPIDDDYFFPTSASRRVIWAFLFRYQCIFYMCLLGTSMHGTHEGL